jgi:hypothetical protein
VKPSTVSMRSFTAKIFCMVVLPPTAKLTFFGDKRGWVPRRRSFVCATGSQTPGLSSERRRYVPMDCLSWRDHFA